jgi:hypothetical protein
MCKFHKDVARDIATNPATGAFDAGRYCVALLAIAHFRTEQYMPSMFSNDGFKPSTLQTPEAIKALTDAGIRKPLEEAQDYLKTNVGKLRDAMNLTAKSCDLTVYGLNIPDTITKNGYQHCESMGPDITKNGPFMDEALVQLFTGYDDDTKTWAKGPLTLLKEAHKPQYEAIRQAAEFFISQPGVKETMKGMFENSLVRTFEEARIDGGVDLKTDGCVMCGHGSRAEKKEEKPSKLGDSFKKSCCEEKACNDNSCGDKKACGDAAPKKKPQP